MGTCCSLVKCLIAGHERARARAHTHTHTHSHTLTLTLSHTGTWEYCGGETRLVGGMDTSNCSYEALEARMEQETSIKLGGSEVSVLSLFWH